MTTRGVTFGVCRPTGGSRLNTWHAGDSGPEGGEVEVYHALFRGSIHEEEVAAVRQDVR